MLLMHSMHSELSWSPVGREQNHAVCYLLMNTVRLVAACHFLVTSWPGNEKLYIALLKCSLFVEAASFVTTNTHILLAQRCSVLTQD